jgi:hypothetical protein
MADLVLPPDPKQPEYEFRSDEDLVFRELSGAMKFVGVALIVLGAFYVLVALYELGHSKPFETVSAVVQSAIYMVLGAWTRGSAISIGRIADTQGRDITNLMSAMHGLRRIYKLQQIFFFIAFCLFVIGFVIDVAMSK